MSLCVLSLPMRFWVNILRNPHFIFDVHVTEVVDASLHVIAQTFMDACTKTEHKLSRVSISPFKERHVCNPVNVSEREAIWAPESQMMSTFCRHLKCVKVDIWLCTLTARWISVIAEATRGNLWLSNQQQRGR